MDSVNLEVTLARLSGASTSASITLDIDVPAVFGQDRPPVLVTINDHTFRSTVLLDEGTYAIPINRATCQAAGVELGDTVTATVARQGGTHDTPVPEELDAALAERRAEWERLSPARRQSFVNWVAEAVEPQTRRRRIERTLEELRSRPAGTDSADSLTSR